MAAAASLIAAQPAAAAEKGIVSDLNWGLSDADQQRTGTSYADLGAGWVRLHVGWKDFEQVKGSYNSWNLQHTGKAIDVARAAGAKVMLMVYNAPSWASNDSCAEGQTPRDPSEFASFMRYLAGYYKGRVAAYEIWNEPNLDRFWCKGVSAASYTATLKAAYPAVKSADPAAQVVFAGTSSNDYAYVEAAYAAGAKGYFDVMATHPYPYCGTGAPEAISYDGAGRISRGSFLAYREIRKAMLARGDDKPIWFTEFGWNTSTKGCNPGAGQWQGGVSEATQADYLTRAFKVVEQDPYVQVGFWYNGRNNFWSADADEPEARFGLMRTDFTPKPSYAAFKGYVAGGGSTGGSTDPGTGTTDPGTGTTTPPTTTKPRKKRTTTNLSLAAASAKAQGARTRSLLGRVKNAQGGRATIVIERWNKRTKQWRTAVRRSTKVAADGRFSYRLKGLAKGRWRARAAYRGSAAASPSASRTLRFSV